MTQSSKLFFLNRFTSPLKVRAMWCPGKASTVHVDSLFTRETTKPKLQHAFGRFS